MGSNQPSDPYKSGGYKPDPTAEKNHQIRMKGYQEAGELAGRGSERFAQRKPIASPAMPEDTPRVAGAVSERKSGGASGLIIFGCIIAAFIAHNKYGVDSGAGYAAVVGVTAVTIWLLYALRRAIGIVLKFALTIGVILFVVYLFAHKR